MKKKIVVTLIVAAMASLQAQAVVGNPGQPDLPNFLYTKTEGNGGGISGARIESHYLYGGINKGHVVQGFQIPEVLVTRVGNGLAPDEPSKDALFECLLCSRTLKSVDPTEIYHEFSTN